MHTTLNSKRGKYRGRGKATPNKLKAKLTIKYPIQNHAVKFVTYTPNKPNDPTVQSQGKRSVCGTGRTRPLTKRLRCNRREERKPIKTYH